ncbi:hypothetical protein BDQ17DRAFT_1352423 [Cyathus striatus]|nr:hypothetical protein BDQ17DRAFT_1352423 [Cyathus striatus]
MENPQVSPMSHLLNQLGITREELNKHTGEMRQFLTAQSDALNSRVSDRDSGYRSRSNSDLRSLSRSTTSSSSFARSLSRARSGSLRDASPPATPIKSECYDLPGTSVRHYDSMEAVIERQRQSRREKKLRRVKEREMNSRHILHPPSPSPSTASQSSHSLDSFRLTRDNQTPSSMGSEERFTDTPTQAQEVSPVTPQKYKYYRDHVLLSGPPHKEGACKIETPTPTRPPPPPPPVTPQMIPIPHYYAYAPYMTYPHYMSVPGTDSSNKRILPASERLTPQHENSPLPPSSPPPPSSPVSSPVRALVNLVSSPGPMEPLPSEDEYDRLPYKLPPGPYSQNKPDMSYAALVGQAILSSPEHRLTLQEIYDWITIVYPYYKRGETTWMNSIRHVLSTTIVFRKVPRDRSVGRTLWAIWDEDLECFKDGGFKKHLCKDIMNGNGGKDKGGNSRGKGRGRKRIDDDDGDSRKAKRLKKEPHPSAKTAYSVSTAELLSSDAPTSFSSRPLFPPTRPTPHHQPYYESCLTQSQTHIPAEILFPPLPSGTAFGRLMESSSKTQESRHETSPPDSLAPVSEFSSALSVPELTPNRSSSPPSSLPSTSDMDVDDHAKTEDGDDAVFKSSLLGPVKFWGESPKTSSSLQPGIELLNLPDSDDEDDRKNVGTRIMNGKQRAKSRTQGLSFPPMPGSPTPSRRTVPPRSLHVKDAREEHQSITSPLQPSSIPPSTPPRKSSERPLSSVRTPISHKGLHMSPSASLAHYKSHLDPPPAAIFKPSEFMSGLDSKQDSDDVADPLRTPRKRTTSENGPPRLPVTPKKLIFSANSSESPFRTPGNNSMSGGSPFRTPRSRSVYDPHDPRDLLNEELKRMGERYDDSPGGLFGDARGSLLYDSPGIHSPGKQWHNSWW